MPNRRKKPLDQLFFSLSDHGGFDIPGAALCQQFFGQAAVCHGKMMFPAVVQQFIAQSIASDAAEKSVFFSLFMEKNTLRAKVWEKSKNCL